MRSPSTRDIQLTRGGPLDEQACQMCVEWALDKLVQGAEAMPWQVLAGLSAPFNHNEVAQLRDRCLALTGELISYEESLSRYRSELVQEVLAATNFKDLAEPLGRIACLRCTFSDDPDWYSIRELAVGVADLTMFPLIKESGTYSYVNRENAVDLGHAAAKRWIERHKPPGAHQ